MKKFALVGAVALSLLTTSGCATAIAHTAVNKPGAEVSAKPASNRTTPTTQPSNPLFDTTLTLPDGQIVKSDGRTVHWKDLTLNLRVTSLPPANAGIDGYLSIVGNHATIISHQSVSTYAGSAMLVYFQRSQPAAAQSSTVTNEYYVIFLGTQYAYVLDALPNGNSTTAKSELIGLLPQWKLP